MSLMKNVELHKIFGNAAAWTPLQLVADLLAHIFNSTLTRISEGFGCAQWCSMASRVMPSITQLLDRDPILHHSPINPSRNGNANMDPSPSPKGMAIAPP